MMCDIVLYLQWECFQSCPDKMQAWQDIMSLTGDMEIEVRGKAASILGTAFSQSSRQRAGLAGPPQSNSRRAQWNTKEGCRCARNSISQVPDKEQPGRIFIGSHRTKTIMCDGSQPEPWGSLLVRSRTDHKPGKFFSGWHRIRTMMYDIVLYL